MKPTVWDHIVMAKRAFELSWMLEPLAFARYVHKLATIRRRLLSA